MSQGSLPGATAVVCEVGMNRTEDEGAQPMFSPFWHLFLSTERSFGWRNPDVIMNSAQIPQQAQRKTHIQFFLAWRWLSGLHTFGSPEFTRIHWSWFQPFPAVLDFRKRQRHYSSWEVNATATFPVTFHSLSFLLPVHRTKSFIFLRITDDGCDCPVHLDVAFDSDGH